MGDFKIRVMRQRYSRRDGEFGPKNVFADMVILDVDEGGRVKIPTNLPIWEVSPVGGYVCYHEWKRMTGVPLVPGKIATLKFSVSQIGEAKYVDEEPSINADLGDPDEIAKREAAQNKVAENWNNAVRAAKEKINPPKPTKKATE